MLSRCPSCQASVLDDDAEATRWAHAIDQADLPTVDAPQPIGAETVQVIVYPDDVNSGKHVLLEVARGIEPTRLTARQKELMRELAETCGDQQHPKAAGFMGKAKRFWEDVTGV